MMNTEPITTAPETTEPAPVTSRDAMRGAIIEWIAGAEMPQATKKLATKLLGRNQTPGTRFVVKLTELRGMCHAATNLDVIKHLRKMRAAGLVEYIVFFGTQLVELRFVTNRVEES